jgi:hypothetical protein
MKLFTQNFAIDSVVGILKRATGGRDEFNHSLYMQALGRARAELLVSYDEANANIGSASVFAKLNAFCNDAIHIQALHGLTYNEQPIDWPSQTAPPERIAIAFDAWLEHKELFDSLRTMYRTLDNPNGIEGSPLPLLTTEQRADPLSDSAESNGASTSAQS